MLEIACAIEGFKKGDISNVEFIRSNDNIAGGLTKSMTQAQLSPIIDTSALFIYVEQWIVRPETEP